MTSLPVRRMLLRRSTAWCWQWLARTNWDGKTETQDDHPNCSLLQAPRRAEMEGHVFHPKSNQTPVPIRAPRPGMYRPQEFRRSRLGVRLLEQRNDVKRTKTQQWKRESGTLWRAPHNVKM
jgi:hypothetical protein